MTTFPLSFLPFLLLFLPLSIPPATAAARQDGVQVHYIAKKGERIWPDYYIWRRFFNGPDIFNRPVYVTESKDDVAWTDMTPDVEEDDSIRPDVTQNEDDALPSRASQGEEVAAIYSDLIPEEDDAIRSDVTQNEGDAIPSRVSQDEDDAIQSHVSQHENDNSRRSHVSQNHRHHRHHRDKNENDDVSEEEEDDGIDVSWIGLGMNVDAILKQNKKYDRGSKRPLDETELESTKLTPDYLRSVGKKLTPEQVAYARRKVREQFVNYGRWEKMVERNGGMGKVMGQIHKLWDEWIRYYGGAYAPVQSLLAGGFFNKNIRRVMVHNSRYPASTSYYQGMNQFSHLSLEEFRASKKMDKLKHNSLVHIPTDTWEPGQEKIPPTVDWRAEGFHTPVQDEGNCASSWAFSALGAIEGQYFRETGKVLDLSEQQVLDCSQVYGTSGCDGGSVGAVYYYSIISHEGLATEQDYRYNATMNKKCRMLAQDKYVASVRGFAEVGAGKEEALQYAVATVGPVSAVIDATSSSFVRYSGGVYNEEDCISGHGRQAVLIMGYGTFQGQDYWLIKNSWGPNWGMGGYMMLARGLNMCGIADKATFPLI